VIDSDGPASAFDAAGEVAWRQGRHWNIAHGTLSVKLRRGTNVLTVHIPTERQMKPADFDFQKAR
jgi:hypothetical protein